MFDSPILILSSIRKIFLYDKDLTKVKFSFGHLISHKNPITGKHDMKVSCLTKGKEWNGKKLYLNVNFVWC